MLPILAAAPLEKDLGDGLTYFRAHELPAELPAASVKPGPIVLDVRFVAAHENAENALDAWLKFRSTSATPVFVLVDAQTAERLGLVLASHQASPGFLTLGEGGGGFTPDVEIKLPPGEEKKAYDALENGASLASVTTENTTKPRNDEAALTHARSDSEETDDEEASDSDLSDSETASPKIDQNKSVLPVSEPVIDRTLQRAIHVHRGLLALKRLERPKA